MRNMPDRTLDVGEAQLVELTAEDIAVVGQLPPLVGRKAVENLAGATQFVRPEDVAGSIPCGPDVDAIVEAVSEFTKAGFTDVALVQIGDEGQEDFLAVAEKEILPALRAS